MSPILDSLMALSATAVEVLPVLEKYVRHEKESCQVNTDQELTAMPEAVRRSHDALMRYVAPIERDNKPLPATSLLDSKNIALFVNNINVTGDTETAHRFQFIQLEPIRDAATELARLGLNRQAKLLENVANFAFAVRRAYNTSLFGMAGKNMEPIQFTYCEPSEE